MNARRTFLIILTTYLILAGLVSVMTPLGEAPDEADHYAYARYIALHRTLPQGPEVTQAKHPPLYHTLAALTGGWTGMGLFLQPNPDVFPIRTDGPANFFIHGPEESFPWRDGPLAFHLARLLSVLLGGVTLWGAWRIGAEAFPRHPEIGLMAAAFLAGLPGYLYISGAMNNDNAVGAFGALALFVMVRIIRQGLSWQRTLALGVIFGLGVLSKVGMLSLWPLAVLALIAPIWSQRHRVEAWVQTGLHALTAWGLGLLVASPWFLRNWRMYGDPLGWGLVRQTVDLREGPVDLGVLFWLGKGLFTYFGGRFGAIGQIFLPGWAYLLAGLFSLALLTGILYFLVRRPSPAPHQIFLGLLLAGAPALTLAGIIRYTAIALGTDQARLMWPSIAVIGVWVGVGLAGWLEMLGLRVRLRAWALGLGTLIVSTLVALTTLLLLVRPALW